MLLQLSSRDNFNNLISRFIPDIQILGNVTVDPSYGALELNLGGQSCYLAPLSLNCLQQFNVFKASQLSNADLPYMLQLSAFEIASKNFLDKLATVLGPIEVLNYISVDELKELSLAKPMWAKVLLNGYSQGQEPYEELMALYPCKESVINDFLDRLEQHQDLITTKKTLSTNLSATVKVLIDSLELTLGQLKSLNVGDALLFNNFINNDRFTLQCAGHKAIAVLNTVASDSAAQESPTDDNQQSNDNKDYYLVMVEPFAPYNDPFLEGKDMSFDNLDNVPLKVDCVLSSFDMKIGDLKSLNTGSRLPLHNDSLSNIKIYVNNNLVALGKVIDIDGTYALQIKELINNSELLEKHMAEQFNQHSAPADNQELTQEG